MRILIAAAIAAISEPAAATACELVEQDAGPRDDAALRVEVVARGLEVPWGIAFLPDGSMLVTERGGRIVRVEDGKVTEVARVEVAPVSESGLLGLALAPDFARSRKFYVYVTVATGHGPRNRVERWELAADNRSAQRDRAIVEDIPSAAFHDGGRIAFGPDGMLYIGTGDATQPRLAQDPDSLAGKILRVTPDGEVPADNPRRGSRVYVMGVRNVEAFDWRDGQLAIADHGPSGELGRTGHDRVVLLPKPAGANLGWPAVYGCEARAGMTAPVLSWREAVPPGGAAFYRDGSIAAWRGDLLVGTLKSHHLHRIRLSPDGRLVEHAVALADRGRLRTVVIGPDRELYVATSNCDGRGTCPAERDVILRVTASHP